MSNLTVEVREYTIHGILHREEMCPTSWCICDIYTPSRSVVPWDCYGDNRWRNVRGVLDRESIPYVCLYTRQTNTSPHGSGSMGHVRFGDSMMPGQYRVAVEKKHHARAVQLIADYDASISKWISDGCNGPMPLP